MGAERIAFGYYTAACGWRNNRCYSHPPTRNIAKCFPNVQANVKSNKTAWRLSHSTVPLKRSPLTQSALYYLMYLSNAMADISDGNLLWENNIAPPPPSSLHPIPTPLLLPSYKTRTQRQQKYVVMITLDSQAVCFEMRNTLRSMGRQLGRKSLIIRPRTVKWIICS